jgi:hypothetical protein
VFLDNFLTNCSDFFNASFGESFLSTNLTDDTDFLDDDLTDDESFLTALRTEGENFFKYAFCLGDKFL